MTSCPTPNKKWFRSAAEAKRHNVQRQQHGCPRLWPYKCSGCDGYHLTTQNYDEQKRLRKAMDDYMYAWKKV